MKEVLNVNDQPGLNNGSLKTASHLRDIGENSLLFIATAFVLLEREDRRLSFIVSPPKQRCPSERPRFQVQTLCYALKVSERETGRALCVCARVRAWRAASPLLST